MSELYEYWNAHYLAAARTAFPEITGRHKLAVGWKLANLDGTTHGDYYWPLVNGDHDLPVLHQADNWKPANVSPCPCAPGDGLCLIPQGQPVREATSGGCRFTSAIGHVLVYPASLALGASDKKRAPWVIDVDCLKPVEALVLLARFTSGADLYGADLYGADLSRADLSRADLYGANLSRANLYGANLSRANLSRANLYGADLSWANLSRANLYGANLSRADLSGADLSGADLSGADLSGANLSGADLSRANLYGANLYGANLSRADLSGANLSGANLSGANLSRATYSQGTLWPVGFDFKAATA